MKYGSSAILSVTLSLLTLPIIGCKDADEPKAKPPSPESPSVPEASGTGLTKTPFAARPKAGATLFEELGAASTGIEFINPIDESHPMKYLYASAMSTGGAAIADVDGDGRPDVFLAGGPGANKLFRQHERMRFTDITESAGVDGGDAWAVGCSFADIDNDGDADLYVCNYLAPNQLFINNGKGVFTESAAAAGIHFTDASHTPSFCDYDADGDLDLYVLTNRWYRPEGFPEAKTITQGTDGRPRILPEWERHYDAVQVGDQQWESIVVGRPDMLCRNNGDGTFTVVNEEAGIAHRGHGLSATWWDWTGDGLPDLWVGNDFDDQDHIYVNRGEGKFFDVTSYVVGHLTWFSMGADFGDLNGDGLEDFLIADMAGSTHFKQKTAMGSMNAKKWFMDNAEPPQLMRNSLFLNAGNGRFMEGAFLAGLASTDWTWAVRLCDFDHDGLNDAYFQCGMSRNFNERDDERLRNQSRKLTQWERYRHLPPLKERNRVFRNRGNLDFEQVSDAWGLNHEGMSYGCAVGDLDNDGALDIVSVRLDEPVVVYRNTGKESGTSITFSFSGRYSNRSGIGVQARLYTEDGAQPMVRQLIPSRGYLGSDQQILHFGTGSLQRIRRVEFLWPSGAQQSFDDLETNHHYTVTEKPDREQKAWTLRPPTQFQPDKTLSKVAHQESQFDDFIREPLLPNKLSALGPAQAWADLNGDGRHEVYLGASKGTARSIHWRREDGSFEQRPLVAGSEAREAEDGGALFFDADGDGDQDLYVVGGGVECEPDDAVLQDHLYLNDGSGRFTQATADALPQKRAAGSSVSAADFDRDGDLDLFIGGRTIPGKYPLAADSQLLRNDGSGRFTDVIATAAPTLSNGDAGIINSASWTDIDNDSWPDLVLAREWESVAIYHNKKGTLVPHSQPNETAAAKGWWNGIAAADLDGDGDFDLVATNFGRNTKYHPKPGKPAMLFYGDVDGTGVSQLLEAEYEGDIVYPIRGRSCSTEAIPSLADRFDTYRGFAAASLAEIYTPTTLDTLQKFSASTLESTVFWNDGSGRFTPQALPWEAQLTPSFGVLLRDMDGDGRTDIVLAQNFHSPQRETGRMAGGLSLLLRNVEQAGETHFTPVWPHRSGINVPGDAKSLCIADLNADGIPDLSFGMNNAPVNGYLQAAENSSRLVIRLVGMAGNSQAIGARISLGDQHAIVTAGAGYLSQSSTDQYFASPTAGSSIKVHWPDGSEQTFPVEPKASGVLLLRQAAAEDQG